jgi:hypothetical protein
VNAVCVDPVRVHELWPAVAPMIREAMTHADLNDYAVVEHAVRNGSSLLWLAWDGREIKGAAITSLSIANGHKFCTIVACGGRDAEQWLGLIADLEQFGRAEGCRSMRIYGRKGWQKVLDGYRPIAVILEKELT